MTQFLIGLTRDLLDTSGAPAFGHDALRVLDDDPAVRREFFAESADEITPADLAHYDAIYVNAPRVTRQSQDQGKREHGEAHCGLAAQPRGRLARGEGNNPASAQGQSGSGTLLRALYRQFVCQRSGGGRHHAAAGLGPSKIGRVG